MIQVKTPKEISGMGHSMKRKEDARFLHGKGHYIDDLKLKGMLYGYSAKSLCVCQNQKYQL